MLHRKMYLHSTIFYQCNGIKYIYEIKTRLVVYLKKKKISENILNKVSLLGELKSMQHKNHSCSMFFLFVSCAFSRWIWPDTSYMLMSTSSTDKNTKMTYTLFLSLAIGLKVIFSISPDRHLLQARMLTFMIRCKLNFCFSLLIVFSACSAKMMYSVSLRFVFACFTVSGPWKMCLGYHLLRKSTCWDLTCRTIQS